MTLTVFGLNHHNAPLETLGKTMIEETRLPDALADLSATVGTDGAVILSTCNRCEIYSLPNNKASEDAIVDWLGSYCKLSKSEIDDHCFSYRGKDAIRHLIRVASGVDSMIVGEPQILGQVKSAYRASLNAKLSGTVLSRLFENTISSAKKARSETELGKHPVSYVSAAVKACQRLFENLPDKRLLLIGTGDMTRFAMRHFKDQGISALTITGRSADRSQRLACEFKAQALGFDRITDNLHHYDVIMSCTASRHPILYCNSVEAALKKRKHRPLCIIDMALPRDVEAGVGELADVYLYTLERLVKIVDDNKQARLAAAAQAEQIIEKKTEECSEWIDSRKADDMIEKILAKSDAIRSDALERSLKMLSNGKSPEHALQRLSTALTGQLVHPALEILKHAAIQGHFELLKSILRRLEDDKDRQPK